MARKSESQGNVSHSWDALEPHGEMQIEAHRRGYDDDLDVPIEFDFLDKGKLHINPKFIPAGKVYKWAKERLLNEDCSDSLDALLDCGYDFVLATDNPRLASQKTKAFSRHRDDPRIRKYGMILMQIDEALDNKLTSYYNRKSQDAQRSQNMLAGVDPVIRNKMSVVQNSGNYQQNAAQRGYYK